VHLLVLLESPLFVEGPVHVAATASAYSSSAPAAPSAAAAATAAQLVVIVSVRQGVIINHPALSGSVRNSI
jgi:hypothetical protein